MAQLPLPSSSEPSLADPRSSILVPALRGRRTLALERLARAEALGPPDGALLVVTAQLCLLRGDPAAARRALVRALDLGEACATGLAPWWGLPSPPPGEHGPSWLRADAWCSRAAWEQALGRPRMAREALERARWAQPHHAEAALVQAGLEWSLAHDLRPRAVLAGLAPERLRRRLTGERWGPAPGDPFGAAGLLSRVRPRAPAELELEADLDEVLACRRLGLPAGPAAARAWRRMRRGEGWIPAAAWLCRVAGPDPSAGATCAAAAEALALAGVGLSRPEAARPVQLVLPG